MTIFRNHHLDAWTPSEDAPPRTANAPDLWAHLLQFAILAPSTRNSQPWRFRIKGEALELLADESRALSAIDPDGREWVMSCGAALLFLRVAMEHFGFSYRIYHFPSKREETLLARIEFDADQHRPGMLAPLFAAITSRHTQRKPFSSVKPSQVLLAKLIHDARGEGANLILADHPEQRHELSRLLAGADQALAESETYRQQLAQQFRPNLLTGSDGMPGYTLGLQELDSWRLPAAIRDQGWGKRVGDRDAEDILTTPVVAVLETTDNDEGAWLKAGQALGRILLRATTAGVSAAFYGQFTELPQCRAALRSALKTAQHPQIVMRLGYADSAEPTPRRSVRSVLEFDYEN